MPTTGSSNGRGHCIVSLDKTLYSDSACLHPGALLTSKLYHNLTMLGGWVFCFVLCNWLSPHPNGVFYRNLNVSWGWHHWAHLARLFLGLEHSWPLPYKSSSRLSMHYNSKVGFRYSKASLKSNEACCGHQEYCLARARRLHDVNPHWQVEVATSEILCQNASGKFTRILQKQHLFLTDRSFVMAYKNQALLTNSCWQTVITDLYLHGWKTF